jgi:hypothetical protein
MTRWVLAILTAVALAATVAMAPRGAAAFGGPALRVEGTVAAPNAYSMGQLSSLATTTVQVVERDGRHRETHTERAASVEGLVQAAQPVLPRAKNAMLRVTVTALARGSDPVTFALGELDANFGNHPAFLSVEEDGRALRSPKLVVPGDSTDARFADRVDRLLVAVANPTPTTPPAGGVDLQSEGRSRTLSATLLAGLPARTVTVSFLAGGGPQQHVETGPNLATALAAAHIRAHSDTWVAAVGSDGYVAVVTPAEATVGGRTLLLSLAEDDATLAQPRLVTGGDVKGGRYVSLVVDLVVGEGADDR